MKERLIKLKKLEEEKDKQYKEYLSKYNKVKQEYFDKIKEVFDFENKFLKIEINENEYAYMLCESVHKCKNIHGRNVINLRGYGFYGVITPYEDSTFMDWSTWFEHEIYIDDEANIEEQLNKITEIDHEEFSSVYSSIINQMNFKHNDIITNFIKNNYLFN